jgi:hypothetical protein
MLPWKRKERIQELKERIDQLEQNIGSLKEEKESFRKRFEAEKERRSELSRKKQEAEKELKKMRQEDREEEVGEEESPEPEVKAEDLSVERTKKILEKLESYKSPEKDLATVYSPGKLSSMSDLKGLKNSISGQNYDFLEGEKFIGFVEPDLIRLKLRSRPFFSENWYLDSEFHVSELREFIEEEKEWAAVSAGDTRIVREESGEILEVEEINDRIERKQKKGGFSQGRFERKRDEQIEQHLGKIEKKVSEDTLLVGEERLCKKLPGKYLGGFDDSRKLVDALYSFRLEKMDGV